MFAGLSRAALARIIPMALFMLFLALRGFVAEHAAWGMDARWIYAAGVVVVAGSLRYFWSDYSELAGGTMPSMMHIVVSAAVGVGVFWMWIHLDEDWMHLDHLMRMLGLGGKSGEAAASFKPVDAQGQLQWALIVVRWIGAALLVPVMEELFWRSYLLRWIDKPEFETVSPTQVSAKAIVLSSAVFMLAHTLWLAAILTGVIYAVLYKRTGNLWAPIIAHGVTNGVLGAWVVWSGNWQFW